MSENSDKPDNLSPAVKTGVEELPPSEAGGGVPLASPDQVGEAAPEEAPLPAEDHTVNRLLDKKILIVDYDSSFIEPIALALQNMGAQVLVARDGYEGYVMAQTEHPHVIIMETMLPRMGGYQLCRLIKYDKRMHTTPVIICSLREQARDRDIGRQVGCNEYMHKPVDPDDLIVKINHLLYLAEVGKSISPLERL